MLWKLMKLIGCLLWEQISTRWRSRSVKVGCKYAVALSAGTAALHLAMKLAGEKLYGKPAPGTGALANRFVAASDMTFDATVNPIVYEVASPCSSTPSTTLGIWTRLRWKKAFELYPEIKVVVVAHLYGTPGKIDEIREICNRHGAGLSRMPQNPLVHPIRAFRLVCSVHTMQFPLMETKLLPFVRWYVAD